MALYLKIGTRLQVACAAGNAKDTLLHDITIPTVDNLPQVPSATNTALSDVADSNFWKPFTTVAS